MAGDLLAVLRSAAMALRRPRACRCAQLRRCAVAAKLAEASVVRGLRGIADSRSAFPGWSRDHDRHRGDPESIPDLTYEEFKTFHRKHYHPSNSRIFIFGDGDTEKYLEFLNDNYLKDFDRAEVDSSISMQKNFDEARRKVAKYPVGKDETLEKKTFEPEISQWPNR